jgi:hypothetical protein
VIKIDKKLFFYNKNTHPYLYLGKTFMTQPSVHLSSIFSDPKGVLPGDSSLKDQKGAGVMPDVPGQGGLGSPKNIVSGGLTFPAPAQK